MNDFQNFRWLLDLLLVGLGTVLWFMFRKLVSDVAEITKALSEYKLHVAEKYVPQSVLSKAIDSFTSQVAEVFRKLERIDDKLDGKADKP